MIRAHKIRLYPNNVQATYFTKACGVARFAFNWALTEWKERFEKGEKVTEGQLRKDLNKIKRKQFPWMLEVTKCAPQLAIKNDLNQAFKNFFAKRAKYPKYRKKGKHESFSLSNDQFSVNGKYVNIPKLGLVKLAEKLRFNGKIIKATISKTADIWYIAVQVELAEEIILTSKNQAVGIDLGVKNFITLSDGREFKGSNSIRKYEKKLKRLNQELSRKIGAKKHEKKSSNFNKTKIKISRLYAKAANARSDKVHKLSTMLVKSYNLIGIEDLDIKEMMSNTKLAKYISDMSFYDFRRVLEYKAILTNAKIVVADKWFASSKLCNVCNNKNEELLLSERNWTCCCCNTMHQRDLNAAINLKNYAIKNI